MSVINTALPPLITKKILDSTWTTRRSNRSKGNQSWIFTGRTDWCWSWNSNTLATWCKELTHWKRPWCWERLKAGGEGDDRRWDSWMVSLTQWTWFCADSGSWWWTGRAGVLWSMGSQRVGHDWATELNTKQMVAFFIHTYVHTFIFIHHFRKIKRSIFKT